MSPENKGLLQSKVPLKCWPQRFSAVSTKRPHFPPSRFLTILHFDSERHLTERFKGSHRFLEPSIKPCGILRGYIFLYP